MKTPIRFENAVRKLYDAYHEGKLHKGNCTACAVGNICNNQGDWKTVFVTGTDSGHQTINPQGYVPNYLTDSGLLFEPQRVIDETGYTWEELARVESAFETNTYLAKNFNGGGYRNYRSDKFIDKLDSLKPEFQEKLKDDQYDGLCAVIEVLCDIEGIENIMDFKNIFNRNEDHSELINKILV